MDMCVGRPAWVHYRTSAVRLLRWVSRPLHESINYSFGYIELEKKVGGDIFTRSDFDEIREDLQRQFDDRRGRRPGGRVFFRADMRRLFPAEDATFIVRPGQVSSEGGMETHRIPLLGGRELVDIRAIGVTPGFLRLQNQACRTSYGPLGVYGSNPIHARYMDLERLHTGLHEAVHAAHRMIEPDATFGDTDRALATRTPANVRAETIANLGAAIYMLNRNPDNPRIMEYLRRLVLQERTLTGLAHDSHDTAAFIARLIENPQNWRLDTGNDGRNLTIFEATARAIAFVGQNQALLDSVIRRTDATDPTVAREREEARTLLCLYDGDPDKRLQEALSPGP
jgi:hypothetical protein